MTAHRVFAYGSNMNLPDLARWLNARGYPAWTPHHVEVGFLDDWCLAWNYRSPTRLGGAANVAPSLGKTVPGALLHVSEDLLGAIDRKEGHPDRYRRRSLPVRPKTGDPTEAWVYVVTPEWAQPGPVPPRRHYRDLMVQAARQLNLPEDHVRSIAAVPVLHEEEA